MLIMELLFKIGTQEEILSPLLNQSSDRWLATFNEKEWNIY